MEIQFHSHPELGDYFKFGLHHSKKRLILVPVILLCAFSAMYLILWIRLGPENWSQKLTVYYCIFLVFTALLPLLNIGLLKAAANRQFRTTVHHDSEQSVGDEGLHTCSELGEGRIPWSHIHKASESKSAIYLYLSLAQALVLSKRFFTDEQYAALHELCRKHILPKRNKLKY